MGVRGRDADGGEVPETSRHAPSRMRGRHRRAPLQAAEHPILEVAGVSARTSGGKVLLDDVSFAVQRGWLVAVVGPTGAGKTSLARALTGGLAHEGTIRLDGVALTRAGSRQRDRIAYVPQDDVLHGQLDLGRTLAYAASLRVPPREGDDERARRVDTALRELGLHHHADVPVASLSGGQRKRANIAAELVGEPDVIVLDEPTSGLDPGYEKAVMTSLRQLADNGRTVIAVTHSLAALAHCDRVLFLAEGGRVAYFGPPARAASYFGSDDAADVFLALDTEPGQAWKERFRAHPAYERYVTPIVTAAVARRSTERRPAPGDRPDQRPGWTQQVGTLLRRQVALLRSDRRHLALLLLQGPLLGLLLWLVLKADSLALVPGTTANTPASETVAMFVALSATWLGASNAVREIVKERHILRREVDAGLAPSAYVAAKAIVLGALTMLQTTILASIACSAQHPPTGGALGSGRLELAVAGALVGLAATALGLLLSATVTSPDKALALLPMTLVTELALAGGWAASLTTPGLEVLRDLTGARWGVEAIGATVAEDRATWLHASIILLGLTAGALVVTAALVHRHTRPALARRSAVAHLEGLRVLAQQRGSALVGAASFGLLAVALALTADGGAADTGRLTDHVAAPPAAESEAPVLEVPVDTVPPTTAAPATVPVVPVTTVQPTPTTVAPTTTAPPAPTTTTTVAPTTTTTVRPTTTTTVAPSNVSSTSSVPWWWWWAYYNS
jgi:ABC-type multidrug transport system ATPase subunit